MLPSLELLLVFLTLIGISYEKTIAKSDQTVNGLVMDGRNRIKMGVVFDGCDNGENDLDVDWDGSPVNYTCYHPKNFIPISPEVKSVEECEDIPEGYYPLHHCMNEKIVYKTPLPTHGDHRPLWPMFGEYRFVPPQRWLHNIEHGAIIMLYHPCAHPAMVNRLRGIVMNCLRKHVITRYNQIDTKRPLALIAWGCKLQMNYVDYKTVVSFIRRKSMRGPEGHYPKEGQYTKHLQRIARPPKGSDMNDTVICPRISLI